MTDTADFSQWAIVANNDDSGFGRQAESLKSLLGIEWHFVVPSQRLKNKPLKSEREIFLPPDSADSEVRSLLKKVKGVIFFERPGHPSLLKLCREIGVTSVCSPNWEWFNGRNVLWRSCDVFVCTSKFAAGIVKSYGFENVANIGPWALPIQDFPARVVTGEARHFIHNAGIVDRQDRKGTTDVIDAFQRVKRQDITLTVRMQTPAKLGNVRDPRIAIVVGNLENPADLYRTGDVAVQPSKMEGNGFMVLEPLYCGIPVITLDYPPMNEYVTQPQMLVKKRLFKRRAFPTYWVKHAHLRLPSTRDLARKIEWCAENDMAPISMLNRAKAVQICDKTRTQRAWSDAMQQVLRG